MKYFSNEHKFSDDYEFYKGKWDGITFDKSDSIFLNDNIIYDNHDFETALIKIAKFNHFEETEITEEQWDEIGEFITHSKESTVELYNDAKEWLSETFKEYGCFTILGI